MKGIQADGSRSLSSSVVTEHLRNILVLGLFMKAGRNGCKKTKNKSKPGRAATVVLNLNTVINMQVTLGWSFI